VIRLLVVDDHAVVRAGLERLLANYDDVELVGTAADGEEAVARSAELQPDVILMDLAMPVLDGIEATRRIMAARPETQVVVLTSFSDRLGILGALDAGAVGYLLKDAEPHELMSGIRAAARGEAPLAPKAAKALLTDRSEHRPVAQLTQRERAVLTLLSAGLPNKQIARQLGISEKTVKGHVTSVFRRIGVDDRTQAALWAQQHGLLDNPEPAEGRS
jgi:DNA-binding NarL/FixJ family response regulator